MYLQVFCLQAVIVDSLMTLDPKSPDQSATENDYAQTVEVSYCNITCCEIFDCTISGSGCEILDDIMVLT